METPICSLYYFCICGIAALAGFTQGLSGFGSIIVSVPLFTLVLDIKTVIPFATILALFLSASLFIQLRRHFRWKDVSPLLVSSFPGVIVGVHALKTIDARLLELAIGLALLGFSFHYLFASAPKRPVSSHWAWIAGFCSGCLGGSVGMTGPPVIVYASLQSWDKDKTKSTLVAYFLAVGFGICAFQAANGLITTRVIELSAIALPAVAVGAFAGTICYRKIGVQNYRKVITLVILALGVVTLYRAY